MIAVTARRWDACNTFRIAVCAVASLGWMHGFAHAAEPQSADLPLKRVVLFNSGVGFFEHSGEIDGDRTIEFKFGAESINDLLKSMVARDLGGGQIAAVTYGSREPLAKTLRTFSIDLTRNPTLADLLRQVRGEAVLITTPQSPQAGGHQGLIVSVERRRVPAGNGEVIDTDVVNLKTAQGLDSVPLTTAIQVRLLNPTLDKEFQDALVLMAAAHATDKKSVSLSFTGQGRRPVRVGYIQDSPIWKTSYRLVLDDKQPPFLQGWAIVENTTEHDWKDISMTLVSGRPVSFTEDLYEPLFVDRPTVAPELFGSLMPRVHDQDMSDREAIQGGAAHASGSKAPGNKLLLPMVTPPTQEPFVTSVVPVGGGGNPAPGNRGFGVGGFGGNGQVAAAGGRQVRANEPLDLKRGVASAASADAVGELFRYKIDRPVSIGRQRSAMLPIVNESVKGEKLSIFNSEVDPKHPMAGLKLHNTTKLHLMQGPITVFDGGEYAGDSRIEDIAPGASRLISYALDLDVEITPRNNSSPEQLTTVKIVDGVLNATRKAVRTRRFAVKNSSEKAKRVLIEQPIDPSWTLLSPKTPAETTRGLYRFAIDAPPSKLVELVVEEERVSRSQFALGRMTDSDFMVYTSSSVASPAVNAALADLGKRQGVIASIRAQIHQFETEMTDINTEQTRIRQNMAQLDKTSPLYDRYVKMFGDQEDQIAKARLQLKDLSADVARQEKALDEFIRRMNVE